MSKIQKITKYSLVIFLLTWCSFLGAADRHELQHNDGMHVKDFDGTTLRFSIDKINIEEILANIIDVNASRIIIFAKHVKNGETSVLIDALKDPFPNYSRCSYGLGSHSLIVELVSHKKQGNSHYACHFSHDYINQEKLISDVKFMDNSPIEKRIVWFFEEAKRKKIGKLVDAIREVHPESGYFKITTWFIGKESAMIELDWAQK